MRWRDIARLTPSEIGKLDAQTLRKYTTQMVSAANKRLRTLRAKGMDTPATVPLDGGRFATPRKTNIRKLPPDERASAAMQDVNRLREELSRVKRFMENETSTVRGYTEFMSRKLSRIMGEQPLTKEELQQETAKERRARKRRERERLKRYKDFDWSAFYRVMERVKRFTPVLDSKRVQQIVFDIVSSSDDVDNIEKMVRDAEYRLNNLYESRNNGASKLGFKRIK